jgi:hypothetical protein
MTTDKTPAGIALTKALEEIGAIDHSKPADAGPWISAPLSIVLDELHALDQATNTDTE